MRAATDRWLTPGNLFGMLGMLGAIIAAWMSFDSRVTRVESDYKSAVEHYNISTKRLDRIEDKLDRLIERDAK
jgi:hypothetical protein